MPGHYTGMSYERGRGSSSNRQSVSDFSQRSSSNENAGQESRTNTDGTRSANQQNNSSAAAAIKNIKQRGEKNPLKNMPLMLTGIGSAMRNRMIALLEQGGTPVYDPSGKIAIGVMNDGVYTGRPRDTDDEDAGNEDRPAPAETGGRLAGRGTEPMTSVNTALPDLPDAPSGPGTGDASADVKKKSKMGRESTIATGPGGLLTPARTRRRSLMSGLIQ